MKCLLAIVALTLGLCAPAQASYAPVLTVEGQTLHWTATVSGGHYLLEAKPPGSLTKVDGTTYTPAPDPGYVVTYRVRPRRCACWSNEVQISYVEEPPIEEEEPPVEELSGAGEVKYRLNAKSAYDIYAGDTAFLKAHVDRILGYGAFAWSHYVPTGIPVVCYLDAYTHWGAHSLNPTHRAEYVHEAQENIAHGCAGIFNDDIEWEGSGQHEVGTNAEVLALLEAVKAAIGSKISEVNTQWIDEWPRIKAGNPYVLKALTVTDHLDKEYGVNSNSGISSPSSYADYLAYVDYLHAHAIHIDQADSTPGNVYEVATELLNNDGGDYIGSFVTPETWSSLYDTNLGAATGPREQVGSAYRRHFVGGTVYVNPPGAATTTVDGHTLVARSGLIVP